MEKLIAQNKKARLNFEIEDQFEAGLVLAGSEVKALRGGKATVDGAYVMLRRDELWLVGAHISEYAWANRENHDTTRDRKLLVHRSEIDKLAVKVTVRGYTLVPLRLYWKGAKVKLEFGLGRGKKDHDKRADLKEKESKREIDRAMKRYR